MGRAKIGLLMLAVIPFGSAAPLPLETESGLDYYPTKPGMAWMTQSGDDEYRESVKSVEETDGGLLITTEKATGKPGRENRSVSKVFASREGIAIRESGGITFRPAYRILKLPATPGSTWMTESVPSQQETFLARPKERVKVPAGGVEALRVESEYSENGIKFKETRWFVRKLGIVKWEYKSDSRNVESVMKSFSAADK